MYNATMAWMYGPLVLAGVGPAAATTSFTPVGDAFKPDTFIHRNSSTALTFVAHGQDAMTRAPKFMPLVPLMPSGDVSCAIPGSHHGGDRGCAGPNDAG